MTSKNITVGQTVRLTKVNKVYATFTYAFKKMGFDDTLRNPRNIGQIQELKGEFFKVFAVSPNKGSIPDLLGIENEDGVQILVEVSGVSVIKRTTGFNFDSNL